MCVGWQGPRWQPDLHLRLVRASLDVSPPPGGRRQGPQLAWLSAGLLPSSSEDSCELDCRDWLPAAACQAWSTEGGMGPSFPA